ncbi:MAG TPA: peptidylprolyl isomerase, partial [Bacteroidota bacterium]
ALVALGRHFPDKVNTSLLTDSRSSLRLKSKVLEALSYRPSLETFKLFLQYLDGDSVRVVMAAWDFFRRTASPFAVREYMMQDASLENAHSLLYEKIQSALNRKDMAITTLVANTVGDTAFFTFFSGTEFEDKVRNELVTAYEKLSSPDDTEAMQAVLEAIGRIGTRQHVPMLEQALQDPDRTVGVFAAAALKRITGQEYSDKLPASTKATYSDYDWQTLESLSPSHTAVVTTSKGPFTIQLLKEHAPFTVLTIVKLARKGFYNGLNFHRVVPNFVIQGGDPRGDGWGGPGFAIRSESSLINYERGMAGIASAGKDTEGCQFFVVHSPQPHLDGRYSIFAKIVQGMDVIDNIQVGDTIVKIEIGK